MVVSVAEPALAFSSAMVIFKHLLKIFRNQLLLECVNLLITRAGLNSRARFANGDGGLDVYLDAYSSLNDQLLKMK